MPATTRPITRAGRLGTWNTSRMPATTVGTAKRYTISSSSAARPMASASSRCPSRSRRITERQIRRRP